MEDMVSESSYVFSEHFMLKRPLCLLIMSLRKVVFTTLYGVLAGHVCILWCTVSEHERSIKNLEKRVSAIELTYVSVDHCSSDWTGSSRRERVSAMNDEWL